jgi:hypothetical protein
MGEPVKDDGNKIIAIATPPALCNVEKQNAITKRFWPSKLFQDLGNDPQERRSGFHRFHATDNLVQIFHTVPL